MNAKTRQKLQPYHWVGMDVSKTYFDAALLSWPDQETGSSLRTMPAKQFPRTKHGAARFVRWLEELLGLGIDAIETRLIMESTGKYSTALAQWLMEGQRPLGAAIVNPEPAAKFIQSLALRNTTDRLSAKGLALYGSQMRPAPTEALSEEEAALRELTRFRQSLVEERTAMKNLASEGACVPAVQAMQKRRIKDISKDIDAIERRMMTQGAKIEGLQEDLALLKGPSEGAQFGTDANDNGARVSGRQGQLLEELVDEMDRQSGPEQNNQCIPTGV